MGYRVEYADFQPPGKRRAEHWGILICVAGVLLLSAWQQGRELAENLLFPGGLSAVLGSVEAFVQAIAMGTPVVQAFSSFHSLG